MRVDAFDFDLPGESIALRPAEPRDSSRLLVADPTTGALHDSVFADLPDLLETGDILVFNDTKVIPARLSGIRTGRAGTTPRIEATLHRRLDDHRWLSFVRPARKLIAGDTVSFGATNDACLSGALVARIEEKREGGEVLLAFEFAGATLDDAIAVHGVMPLPPYIAAKRPADAQDEDDYQTIFAAEEGAVAAPTAGLHFTPSVLQALDAKGIRQVGVTLHVGAGTFLPVKAETTEEHRMHAEWGTVSASTAYQLNAARARGHRIVCIGTTSLRLLESAADEQGRIGAFEGETSIFMTPGHRFRTADMLLTNFHLPRSTLFMLVCAFCGTEFMHEAYRHAIAEGYRFYSYGDACLLSLKTG